MARGITGLGSDIRLDTRRLDRLERALPGRAQQIHARQVIEAVTWAKHLAKVVTGAMQGSIYYNTEKESTYGAAVATAKARNPSVNIVPEEPVSGPLDSVIAPAVDYGLVIEFGSSTHSAQPYLTPAIERAHANAARDWAELFRV